MTEGSGSRRVGAGARPGVPPSVPSGVLLGVLLILAGLGLGGVALYARSRGHGGGGAGDIGGDSRVTAAATRVRLDQALATATHALEPKVTNAAALPEIASGLALDADSHTFEDLLENEDWWAPYRADFAISGVVSPSGMHAMLGNLSGDLRDLAVIRQAREGGIASGVVVRDNRTFILAAARVPHGKKRASGSVVFLGVPFERPALQAISDAVEAPVGLSDGRRLLAFAGPASAEAALSALCGREDQGVIGLDDGWVGVSWPLDRGLYLLGLLPAPPTRGGSKLGTSGLIIGVGGVFFFLCGLFLLLRPRKARSRVDSDNPMVITQPFGGGPKPSPMLPTSRARTSDLRNPAPAAAAKVAPALPGTPTSPEDSTIDRGSAAALASPDATQAGAGAVLGRYRLMERIGEGGMAEIFIAAAHGVEGFVRHFVVKRLHPHMARSRDAVNQFIDEARLQSVLVHSNIVPVFDFGRAGEEYFLALEYIHGRDLERLVRRHVEVFGRSLSVPVAFYLMHEVLDALAYAHGRTDTEGKPFGIVHRDVAPGNILISIQGEVKLSDFGIAKAEGRMSRTEVGMIKGNVSFMSPEQARGEPVDLRSDLFSAAVVLYYCLTAQFLYSDETMFNRLVRAAVGPAMSEFTLMDELPQMAATVLRKALSLDPTKRYQNAREFARDLTGHFTSGRAELSDLMDTLFPELKRDAH